MNIQNMLEDILPKKTKKRKVTVEEARNIIREEEIEKSGYSRETIQKIKRMVENSQYKRTMPPVCKMHARTIGMDFRYLRDWNK